MRKTFFLLTGVAMIGLFASGCANVERKFGRGMMNTYEIVRGGEFRRTILVGMKKERQDPREIEGRQALFVVNLPPRTMAGVESEGMLFDIGYADGVTPVIAVPESPVPDGTRAG